MQLRGLGCHYQTPPTPTPSSHGHRAAPGARYRVRIVTASWGKVRGASSVGRGEIQPSRKQDLVITGRKDSWTVTYSLPPPRNPFPMRQARIRASLGLRDRT
jgi:hypothetical protein